MTPSVIGVADALTAAMQILSLVQSAQANGKNTITQAEFDAAVATRNTALAQLDADIAAQQTGAGAAVPVHE